MLEKAVVIKRFEYIPLGKELKKQTSVSEKRYQKFDNVFESNEKWEDKIKNRKFHQDTIEIKPNNKEQTKYFKKSKNMVSISHELYNKVLSIYKTLY